MLTMKISRGEYFDLLKSLKELEAANEDLKMEVETLKVRLSELKAQMRRAEEKAAETTGTKTKKQVKED